MPPDVAGIFSRSPSPGPWRPVFSVLFVCTGNLCRSPTAEAIAWRELGHHPDAALRFASAGTHALEGNPAPAAAVAAAAALGADLEHHRARELTRRRVREANLVLCMAAEHRPFVLACDRTSQDRIFTLTSFTRAVTEFPLPATSPEELVVMAGEEARDLPGDDVPDPIGRSRGLYAAVARQLDELVSATVATLATVAKLS